MNPLKLFFPFLFLISSFQIQAKSSEVTITKETSFKSEGSFSSKTISRLFPDDKVVFLNDCNFYYCKIEVNGKIGWVKKRLIGEIPSFEKQLQKGENAANEITESILNNDTGSSIWEGEKDITGNNSSNNSLGFLYGIILVGVLIIGRLGYLNIKLFLENKKIGITIKDLNSKYQGMINVDEELIKRKNEVDEVEKSRDELRSKYYSEKEAYEKLIQASNLLKDDLYIAEFGFYKLQLDKKTSETFQLKIKEVREKQKRMIAKDLAILGGEDFKINRSSQKGREVIDTQKKLMLRAFNGECNNIIKSARWNNKTQMEERILKSAETINKIGEPQDLEISTRFSFLKILELRTTFEFGLKKSKKKGIQKRRREKIID